MGLGLAIASGNVLVALLIAAVSGRRADGRGEERRSVSQADVRRRSTSGIGTASVDGARRFSWAQAMANHESRAIIGFLLAVGLLALKAARNV